MAEKALRFRNETKGCRDGKFSQKLLYNISNQFQLLMQEKSKLRVLQTELLKLKNNFNLRGALGMVSIFIVRLINHDNLF